MGAGVGDSSFTETCIIICMVWTVPSADESELCSKGGCCLYSMRH